ncbi:MAG: RNA-binding protein [Nitrosomonadaceae bacterium]|nr:ribosome assembly RNA-binding protein YhbY [Nitrosospira sp.]MBI0412938.1 ribosome assembly RNA-binding protein YhbY [Nitrosospira sp.]MCG3771299.1 RNA-binding protein [Nitrosomonadaceae bacterium]
MLDLTLTHRHALRALAHSLSPIVMIGEAGLSENVINELDRGLRSHELIKVKVLDGDRQVRGVLIEEICQRLEAAPVQHIGKILVIYRPKPEEVTKTTPAKFRKKREPRRLKRSFQD